LRRRRLTLRALLGLLAVSFVAGAGFALVTRKARRRVAPSAAATPSSAPAQHRRPPYVVAETILDGTLGKGWEDWGWGAHELNGKGAPSVVFASYGGIMFHHAELTGYYGALVFRIKANQSFGDFLEVALKYQQVDDKTLPRVPVEPGMWVDVGGGWKEALVPWSLLNPTNSSVDRVVIRANKGVPDEKVLLDKVVLTKPEASGIAAPPLRATELFVDCSKPAQRINPLIYGIARATNGAGETAHRIGGNAMTRLNWELGTWNSASDWYFENTPGDGPDGVWHWLDDGVKSGAQMAMVVPTIGWVAKDGTSVGFPESKFPKQRGHDPNKPEAGDGYDAAGKPIHPGPPTQTSVAAPPELIKRWLEKLKALDAARGSRSVHMYILDNEPSLWNSTHRDVHPDPLTYDELLDRTVRYASVIRDVDPDAVIAGPAEWGWPAYFMSAKDIQAGWLVKPDRRAHSDEALLAWYLEQLAAYEKKNGKRLLDVLDVHYYPQAADVYGQNAKTDAKTSALRLRSTRSLWDAGYTDESWINDSVRLIPRLKDWVAINYPGTGISLGEWSFGADTHISGGLAIAEALGRFGEQGLTSAFYWEKLAAGTPGYWAFRTYRNFDGQGGRFLDWSVPKRETPDVSLFASRDDGATHFVLVLVNRDPTFAADAHIDVSSCGAPLKQRAFVYAGAATGFAPATTGAATGTTLTQSVPPYGIAVVDVTLTPRPH
jgi:hypothetical protein